MATADKLDKFAGDDVAQTDICMTQCAVKSLSLSLWLEITNHFSKEQTVFGTQCASLLKQQYTFLCSAHNHFKNGVSQSVRYVTEIPSGCIWNPGGGDSMLSQTVSDVWQTAD